jgi:hypothetical protein
VGPDLAAALAHRAVVAEKAGNRAEALVLQERAVALRRELALTTEAGVGGASELAKALSAQAALLTRAGRSEDAITSQVAECLCLWHPHRGVLRPAPGPRCTSCS